MLGYIIAAVALLALGGGGAGEAAPTSPPGGRGTTPPGCPVNVYASMGQALDAAKNHPCSVIVVFKGETMIFRQAASAARLGGGPCAPVNGTGDPAMHGELADQGWLVGGAAMVDGELVTTFGSEKGASLQGLAVAIRDMMAKVQSYCEKQGPGGEEPTPPDEPTADEPTADEPTVHEAARQIAETLIAENATPGMLYRVRAGDNPLDVAQAALGTADGDPRNAPYARAMVQSRYNWTRFASQPDGKEDDPTPAYLGGGAVEGVWADISAAFLKIHEDLLDALLLGRWPQRTVSWGRGPNGEYFTRTPNLPIASAKTYPLIYLPEVGTDDDPVLWPTDDERGNPTELIEAVGLTLDGPAMTEAAYKPYTFGA